MNKKTKKNNFKKLKLKNNLPVPIKSSLMTELEKNNQILSKVRSSPVKANKFSAIEKIEKIQKNVKEILEVLGLDLSDDSLADTPKRVAKMYVNEIFSGLDPARFPKITLMENSMEYDQMVCVQDIEVISTCEHHFQPIDGFATVAYIPNERVIGLSKINRIVEYFARRPQVQERLTKQVADCLEHLLGTDNIAVHINAKHYCVIARGIQDTHSSTTTSDLRGDFKTNPATRTEFLKQCRLRAN